MFDSDLGKNEGLVVRRRAFLLTSASALAGAILWSLRRPSAVQAKAAKGASEEVTIVEFSDSGVRLKTVHVPKGIKTEEEWRKQLSRGVFTITRQADTESTILTEVVGGLAIILGAFVTLVSLPMAAVLLVAMFTVHLPYGFSSIKLMAVTPAGAQFGPPGYEVDLLYVACLATLVLVGPKVGHS